MFFDRATEKSLMRLPHCATVQTHLHLALLSFASHTFFLERKDVRRCCATHHTLCCASRFFCPRATLGRKWSTWLLCQKRTLNRWWAQRRSRWKWNNNLCRLRRATMKTCRNWKLSARTSPTFKRSWRYRSSDSTGETRVQFTDQSNGKHYVEKFNTSAKNSLQYATFDAGHKGFLEESRLQWLAFPAGTIRKYCPRT